MAERRMFSNKITSSDQFLDMPSSAQALYFHLGMAADDEGVINNPRSIMRNVRSTDDDMKILLSKRFCIYLDDASIIVIKHWKMNNYIQKDRFHPSTYHDVIEKNLISTELGYSKSLDTKCIQPVYNLDTKKENNLNDEIGNNGEIQPSNGSCIQSVYKMDTEEREGEGSLGKVSLGKVRLGESNAPTPARDDSQISVFGSLQNVFLTEQEMALLTNQIPDIEKRIEKFSLYLKSSGKTYQSHFATILKFFLEDQEASNSKKKSSKDDIDMPWLDKYCADIMKGENG